MPLDLFATARPQDPHRVTFRYDPPTRRLAVSGEHPDRDMRSISDLIERRIIPAGVEAVVHTAPSTIVSTSSGNYIPK